MRAVYPPMYRQSRKDVAALPFDQRAASGRTQRVHAKRFAGALHFWQSQPAQPQTLRELRLLAECLANKGDGDAIRYIDELARITPNEAEALRSEISFARGRQKKPPKVWKNFCDRLMTIPGRSRTFCDVRLSRRVDRKIGPIRKNCRPFLRSVADAACRLELRIGTARAPARARRIARWNFTRD